MKHIDNCSAPICHDHDGLDTVWWAGEEVCNKRPYNEVQKIQQRINREIKTNPKCRLQDKSWTHRELLRSKL